MRILHIGKFYSPRVGGMETHLKDLCDYLKERVHLEVVVANDDFQTVRESVDGVSVVRMANLGEFRSNSLCPTMAFEVARRKADLIHLHFPNPMGHMAYLLSRISGKLVITWHSDIIKQKILLKGYAPFLKTLLKRADGIIATSPNYINSSPFLGPFRSKCTVVPLSISPKTYEMDKEKEREVRAIRERYGSQGEKLLLFVGRLSSYKGVRYLLEAMKEVATARLLIVGTGEGEEEARSLIEKTGLGQRVILLGKVPHLRLPLYYHACHIFVLPSCERSEAFGIVQLEAMACGKPVISTNLSTGVPFVNEQGKTGLVVPPGEAAPLARAINTLLHDEKALGEMGQKGRERVFREFTTETMGSRTFELYENILSKT